MFDIFGEMESAEELNKTAEGLKNEGDKENLYKLADENGIDRAEADLYFEGMTDAFAMSQPLRLAKSKWRQRS